MRWSPHVTVAAVVQRNNRFLLVRERGESGALVYNQPAGHLEEGESLYQAVIRETLEETGWQVRPSAVLGVRLYRSPTNGITYLRHCFIAEPVAHYPHYELDDPIEEAVWLSRDEIEARRDEMRSELVTEAIGDYCSGRRYPLELFGA